MPPKMASVASSSRFCYLALRDGYKQFNNSEDLCHLWGIASQKDKDIPAKLVYLFFNKMDLIEQWGTGIQRIINRAKEYELPKPEFREIGNTFRVNLYRKADKKLIKADKKPIKEPIKTDKKPIKADGKSITTSKQRKKFDRENLIIKYVKEYGSISNKEARQILVLAESTTKRFLKEMVKEGLLLEKGERKNRRYILANER